MGRSSVYVYMTMRRTVFSAVAACLAVTSAGTPLVLGAASLDEGPVASKTKTDTAQVKTERPKAERPLVTPSVPSAPSKTKPAAKPRGATSTPTLDDRREVEDQVWDTEFFVNNGGRPVSPLPWDTPVQVASRR